MLESGTRREWRATPPAATRIGLQAGRFWPSNDVGAAFANLPPCCGCYRSAGEREERRASLTGSPRTRSVQPSGRVWDEATLAKTAGRRHLADAATIQFAKGKETTNTIRSIVGTLYVAKFWAPGADRLTLTLTKDEAQ